MTPRRSLDKWLGVLVLVTGATIGCASKNRQCNESETLAVDPTLMAFLSRARAAHHEADLHENDLERCIRSLQQLVDGPIPGLEAQRPVEAREVLADTHARIAELESKLGRFDSARNRIDKALLLVPDVSYFRGHLFETRGLVEQRWAEALSLQGRTEDAKNAKARALEAFETAMTVQADVIRAAKPQRHTP
jgi:tetratricopeptide (TPR) repeat protein